MMHGKSPKLPWPRWAVGLLLAGMLVGALMLWRLAAGAAVPVNADAPRMVRLHVVANSNSAEDQTLKLHVRDRLLPLVYDLTTNAVDPATAAPADVGDLLMAQSTRLLEAANDELQRRGASYRAVMATEVDDDGRLAAVKVVLGDGAGNNWFCVLVPPLCFSDLDAVERRPATEGQTTGVRFAWRWLEQLFSRLTLPVERVGQVDQDYVDANLAHAGPRDGDVGTAAE